MRDLQMDGNKREGSPSTGVSGASPKRRKLDDPVDPPLLIFLAHNAQATTQSSPNESLHMSLSMAHVDQITSKINKLFDEERELLESDVEFYKLANENLELRLAESEKRCDEAKAAQMAAEANVSQLRTEMNEEMTKLLHKNSQLKQSMIDQGTENTAKLTEAADKIMELEQEVKSALESQEKFNLKVTQLQEANVKISKLESDQKSLWEQMQTLLPSVAWIKKFGKKSQSGIDSSETPEEAPEDRFSDEMTFSDHKVSDDEFFYQQSDYGLPPVLVKYELEHSEDTCQQQQQKKQDFEQEFEDLKVKREDIGRGKAEPDFKCFTDDFSVSSYADPPKEIRRVNLKSDNDSGNEQKDQRIWVDEFYVLASDPTFFEIDWETLYKKMGRTEFECSECGEVKTTKSHVQDHIWTKHYGGRLRCPLCTDDSGTFSRRCRIKRHMATMHTQ